MQATLVSNRELPMMPWFPADFAGATTAWTFVERALYRCLLDAQWTLGALPHDETRLARIAGLEAEQFREAWPMVSSKFETTERGLVNQRLEEHRKKAQSLVEQRASAAQASVQARQQRALSERSSARSTNAEHPSPSPSLSSSPSEEKKKHTARRDANGHAKDAEFETFEALYPQRGGDQRWHEARKAVRARLREGHTWAQIHDGVRRYAEWCRATGKIGTETVKQAATFVGPGKPFLEAWTLPATKADIRQKSNVDAFAQAAGKLFGGES